MDRVLTRGLRAFAALVFALSLGLDARAVPVDISAKVDGSNMLIGTLDASIPDNANPARIIGEFKLRDDKKFLDDWYDFRWVNVETKYTVNGIVQGSDPVTGDLPAIDPPPPPSAPAEDNEPFYFNGTEWANGTFNGVTIHDEGKASRFVDRPKDAMLNSLIDFTTYLTVRSLTDAEFAASQFCLLGWFDWTYDNMGNFLKGTSTVHTVSSVAQQSDVDLINAAIARAKPDGFGAWKATLNCDLRECVVPEPESWSLVLLALALTALLRTRWLLTNSGGRLEWR